MSYHNCGISVSGKIYDIFRQLNPQTCGDLTPRIESWIEVALTQELTTVDELIVRVSNLAWFGPGDGFHSSFARFLKRFRDSSRRSEQARSFVDGVCARLFRWFAAASADDIEMNQTPGNTAQNGGTGFVEGTSTVGLLIECQLLDHELVRLHLIKRLTHHYPYPPGSARTVRASAIYRLFAVAGNTLLRGLLELEDVQVCFEMLETQLSSSIQTDGLSTANLKVWRAIYASHRNTLTCTIRNSVSFMPYGSSSVTRRDETTKKWMEVVNLLPKSLQTLKHPLPSLPKIYLL